MEGELFLQKLGLLPQEKRLYSRNPQKPLKKSTSESFVAIAGEVSSKAGQYLFRPMLIVALSLGVRAVCRVAQWAGVKMGSGKKDWSALSISCSSGCGAD